MVSKLFEESLDKLFTFHMTQRWFSWFPKGGFVYTRTKNSGRVSDNIRPIAEFSTQFWQFTPLILSAGIQVLNFLTQIASPLSALTSFLLTNFLFVFTKLNSELRFITCDEMLERSLEKSMLFMIHSFYKTSFAFFFNCSFLTSDDIRPKLESIAYIFWCIMKIIVSPDVHSIHKS